MFREFLIMARWRLLDVIIRKAKVFKLNRKDTLKNLISLALLGMLFAFILHLIRTRRNNDFFN